MASQAKVYIANFGQGNYEWQVCLERSTIAVMNDVDLHEFWGKGDREGYIQQAMQRKTAAGITATRQVASRWFNLMTIVSETCGDIWIHHQDDELWWTTSQSGSPTFEEKVKPTKNRVIVCHKPCNPWSNKTKSGNQLQWNTLHPKAHDILSIKSTIQEPSGDNAEYARALIAGADLTPWHSRRAWKKKSNSHLGKGGEGKIYNSLEKSAYRMASQAFRTADYANGQGVMNTLKNKEIAFASNSDLEEYIIKLYNLQEGLCALTDLHMQLDGEEEDKEMLCSLDRIDSGLHYAPDNLQLVCRFVNRWKSDSEDSEFRRLIYVIRSQKSIDSEWAA